MAEKSNAQTVRLEVSIVENGNVIISSPLRSPDMLLGAVQMIKEGQSVVIEFKSVARTD